jgi:RluA family pseudouridine synthase
VDLQSKAAKKWEGIRILFEDRDCIVVDKPAYMLSVPQDIPGEASVLRHLRNYTQSRTIYPVHRLDRETSGVMVFAKTQTSKERFKALFYARDIQRTYYAVCVGKPTSKSGTIKTKLIEEVNGDVSVTEEEQGKLAITHYEVVQERRKTTLLKLNLETGRKHQIRVHCAHIGYPILGDTRYGAPKSKRLFLHAETLGFVHPFSQEKMTFTSKLPQIFCA